MKSGWTGERYRHGMARKGIKSTCNTKMHSKGRYDDFIEQVEDKNYRLTIVRDEEPMNPREWDNLGKMVCWHSRYSLGDEQPRQSPDEWLEELAIELDPSIESRIEYWRNGVGFDKFYKQFGNDGTAKAWNKSEEKIQEIVLSVIDKKTVMLPLNLYDHSGITMSTSKFSCPWDSGQVGYIYVTTDSLKKEYGKISPKVKAYALKTLQTEVEIYDDYLTGNSYGYRLEQKIKGEWEEIDSCYGFLGSDYKVQMEGNIPKEAMNVYNKLK